MYDESNCSENSHRPVPDYPTPPQVKIRTYVYAASVVSTILGVLAISLSVFTYISNDNTVKNATDILAPIFSIIALCWIIVNFRQQQNAIELQNHALSQTAQQLRLQGVTESRELGRLIQQDRKDKLQDQISAANSIAQTIFSKFYIALNQCGNQISYWGMSESTWKDFKESRNGDFRSSTTSDFLYLLLLIDNSRIVSAEKNTAELISARQKAGETNQDQSGSTFTALLQHLVQEESNWEYEECHRPVALGLSNEIGLESLIERYAERCSDILDWIDTNYLKSEQQDAKRSFSSELILSATLCVEYYSIFNGENATNLPEEKLSPAFLKICRHLKKESGLNFRTTNLYYDDLED